MARVFVGMVLSLSLGTHYMGRRFLYSDLNSSAYLGTVKCIKTHVQNQINKQRRGRRRRRRRRVFFLSQRGDGRREYKFSIMYWMIAHNSHLYT